MKAISSVLHALSVIGFVYSYNNQDNNVDYVSRQLPDYKAKHQAPTILTTSSGKPVDIRDTDTLNSEFYRNQFLIESIKHAVHEKIPDRKVLSKAIGAFGYLEITNDVTKYSKAKLFEKKGKRTQLVARLSTGENYKGVSDLSPVSSRGFSIKFYTEEGNWDLLSVQTPVFFYKDPVLFASTLHAICSNPTTTITDFTSLFDFITLRPESLHGFLWAFSEYGLPRGYRHMISYPIHAFELYNKNGDNYFVRFKFLPELGFDSFSLEEAAAISGFDPDIFSRDLYNSIESGNYPVWKMYMDVLLERDINNVSFDPFDVTKLWPNGTYETVPIGRIVLDRNVDNEFAQVDLAAYNPSNLVPGILEPLDQVFKGRVMAYTDVQIYRLGVNRNKIAVNCPLYAKTYDRDGVPPVWDNMKGAPNYFPNSFNGPMPTYDEARPTRHISIRQTNKVDLKPCADFYNLVLTTDAQKQRLIDALVQRSLRVEHTIQDRFINLLLNVDKQLGKRFAEALAFAKITIKLPNFVNEVNRTNPNPFNRK